MIEDEPAVLIAAQEFDEKPARGIKSKIEHEDLAVDDADQVKLRKVMALSDELRADDDVETAGGDVVELGAQRVDGGDEV
jgi:hypothetical protein